MSFFNPSISTVVFPDPARASTMRLGGVIPGTDICNLDASPSVENLASYNFLVSANMLGLLLAIKSSPDLIITVLFRWGIRLLSRLGFIGGMSYPLLGPVGPASTIPRKVNYTGSNPCYWDIKLSKTVEAGKTSPNSQSDQFPSIPVHALEYSQSSQVLTTVRQ